MWITYKWQGRRKKHVSLGIKMTMKRVFNMGHGKMTTDLQA